MSRVWCWRCMDRRVEAPGDACWKCRQVFQRRIDRAVATYDRGRTTHERTHEKHRAPLGSWIAAGGRVKRRQRKRGIDREPRLFASWIEKTHVERLLSLANASGRRMTLRECPTK